MAVESERVCAHAGNNFFNKKHKRKSAFSAYNTNFGTVLLENCKTWQVI